MTTAGISTSTEADFAKRVRDTIAVPLMAVAQGMKLSKDKQLPALDGIGAQMAAGYAINVRHDREGWNLRKGAEMAQSWRNAHPEIADLERRLPGFADPPPRIVPAPTGARVYMVEIRWPTPDPGPHDARISSEVMVVTSDEQKALDYIRTSENTASDEMDWIWALYWVVLDDRKMLPHDWRYFDREGNEHKSPSAAHAAGRSAPPAP